MKLLSVTNGIKILSEIRSVFGAEIRENYEVEARPCSACPTPGICCRDEHFVNVHVSRLEAAAIAKRIDRFDERKRDEIYSRAENAISKYGLDGPGDSRTKTYACPLFEAGTGCLVHDAAKPLPCISHACYESEKDLPPDSLLDEAEQKVFELNRRVYGKAAAFEPLPVAVSRIRERSSNS